jgi:hypothetical protein
MRRSFIHISRSTFNPDATLRSIRTAARNSYASGILTETAVMQNLQTMPSNSRAARDSQSVGAGYHHRKLLKSLDYHVLGNQLRRAVVGCCIVRQTPLNS